MLIRCYHTRMLEYAPPALGFLHRVYRGARHWLLVWWRILRFALLMLILAATPSSYNRQARQSMARHLVLASSFNVLWFTVLTSLISLVLIRIVVVTAQSYGVPQYALQTVVRVLVLELIPLTAALFVALRVTLPEGLEFAQLRANGALAALQREGVDLLRQEFLPRAVAGLFSVWLLAAVSCVTALLLAYLSIYGFTPYALAGYTRVVGQVFEPAVGAILALKILFFSFAVALIPLAGAYYDGSSRHKPAHGLIDMLRLFSVLLLVEVAALMGNYY